MPSRTADRYLIIEANCGHILVNEPCSFGRQAEPIRRRKALSIFLPLLPLLTFHLLGCANGTGGNSTPTAPFIAPAIATHPANQSVPMSLAATFSVTATGTSLAYQWSKNGSPIPGATASSYTTPASAFSDTGSSFTVTVSNSAGSVTSNAASLTITARAPKPGDLRFQQVAAPSTAYGYAGAGGLASNIPGRMGTYFGSGIGTPLFLSLGNCSATPPSSGLGCSWIYSEIGLPARLANLGLSTGYGGDFFDSFQADLQSSSWPAGGQALAAPNSVITSLDLEPSDNLFAASWIQTNQGGGFDMSQHTVVPLDLQAAATQEGVHSRVITAVTYNAGQVVYLSYGWQGDTSTTYETKVATATINTIASAAADLAAQGYIITATGGSGLNNSFILVGTRVQGDTMARPFVSQGHLTGLPDQGYAIIGAVFDSTSGGITFLGER